MTVITSLDDVYDILARHASERPEHVALVSPRGVRTTYAGLHEAVTAAATRLKGIGMNPGDAVAFSVRPSVEAIILILATGLAGGVVVAADPGMGAELFARRMASVQPRFVMAETLLYAVSSSRVIRAILRRRGLVLPQVGRMPGARFVRVGRWLPGTPRSIPYGRLVAPLAAEPDPPLRPKPDDAVFIVFTSGTTEDPRAVVHTARSLTATLQATLLLGGLDTESVAVTDQLHSALPALLAGSTLVIPKVGAGPAETVRLLHAHRATHTFSVPSDLHRLVTHCEEKGVRFPETLRYLALGAGPVDRPLLTRLRLLIQPGTDVRSFYALTEMPLVTQVTMDEKLYWDGEGDLIGSPLPGAAVRVDERGELYVSGDRLCGHYLGGQPLKETATGDLARIDADGRVVLLGRSKDMIIRGHFNIYPALYEDRIATLPGVRRCAMIGVWDDAIGDERVVLVVEPFDKAIDADSLQKEVKLALERGDLIDQIALPDEIVIIPLPEAGRTHKIDRAGLRKMLTEFRA